MANEKLIAVFIDYENLAIGVQKMNGGSLHIDLVLKRLLEKGRIVFKRAYCDWGQYRKQVREIHTNGIEMIDIPQSKMSGKNSADIHMVVDALDLCYSKPHIETFALLSGDSDFSPLVSKLKENDKRVIGCGVKSSTSELLIAGCDEFIYYDDLIRVANKTSPTKQNRSTKPKDKKLEALDLLVDTVRNLEFDYEPLWGSIVKQTIRRVSPSFNEDYYGFRSFSELLEDAEKRGLIRIEWDEDRGNYKVRLANVG